ncbi:MAG: hypothetical protein AB7H79_03655 [Sphingomonas sp.]
MSAKTGQGRALPLYQALLECGYRDGPRLAPGTSAAIWHAIDSRRAAGGARDEIRILEDIAVEVHVLKQSLARLADDAEGDLVSRCRIGALTRQWLQFAPLRA